MDQQIDDRRRIPGWMVILVMAAFVGVVALVLIQSL